jgi:hypothetical protein
MRLIRYGLRHMYLKNICLRVYDNVQNGKQVVPTLFSTDEKTPNVVNIVPYSGVSNSAQAVGFWI